MSFYVKKQDMDEIQESCMQLRSEVVKAAEKMRASVQSLNALTSFEGDAAESIKAYFTQVHQFMTEQADFLMAQLESDFTKYLALYDDAPIAESRDAKISEKQLVEKRIWVGNALLECCLITEIFLGKARASLPANANVDIPSASLLSGSLREQADLVAKFQDQVSQAEQSGKTLFGNAEGNFQRVFGALMSILASTKAAQFDITSFSPAAFHSIINKSGFQQAYETALSDQQENYEKMIATEEAVTKRINERLEEEKQKAAAWKGFWSDLGLACEVGILVLGVAAVIGTGGAAAPVLILKLGLGGAATISSMNSIKERADQRIKMVNGDIGADRERLKDIGYKDAKTFGKMTKEGLNVYYEPTAGNITKGVGAGGSILIDKGGSYLKDRVDSKEGKLGIDLTTQVASESWDHYIDKIAEGGAYKVDGISTSKAALGFAQKGVDYGADKADDTIEAAQNRQESLQRSWEISRSRSPFDRPDNYMAASV